MRTRSFDKRDRTPNESLVDFCNQNVARLMAVDAWLIEWYINYFLFWLQFYYNPVPTYVLSSFGLPPAAWFVLGAFPQ